MVGNYLPAFRARIKLQKITTSIIRITFQSVTSIFATLLMPSISFADNGGGAIVEALIIVTAFGGIVSGLIAGILRVFFFSRTPWKLYLFALIIPIAIAFIFPAILAIYTVLPLFIPVFASTVYMVNGLFKSKHKLAESFKEQKTGIFNIYPWIAGTYLFWSVVSLINLPLFFIIPVFPLLLIFPEHFKRFLPFLLPPFAAATILGIIITIITVKKFNARCYWASLIFNICFLVSFLILAESYRYHLMTKSLQNHTPQKLESSLFLESVLTRKLEYRGSPHAYFYENGNSYYWSYAERKFLQIPR